MGYMCCSKLVALVPTGICCANILQFIKEHCLIIIWSHFFLSQLIQLMVLKTFLYLYFEADANTSICVKKIINFYLFFLLFPFLPLLFSLQWRGRQETWRERRCDRIEKKRIELPVLVTWYVASLGHQDTLRNKHFDPIIWLLKGCDWSKTQSTKKVRYLYTVSVLKVSYTPGFKKKSQNSNPN